MKAEELRLGNYTEYNIIDEGRDEWIFNQVEISDLADPRDLRPIPLTEEWLLNFGFERDDEDEAYVGSGLYIEDRNRDRYMSQEKRDSLKDSFGVWFVNSGRLIRDIKYVHQLQNLYFALTGEELTIKEKVK